jgi:hypothetical protein
MSFIFERFGLEVDRSPASSPDNTPRKRLFDFERGSGDEADGEDSTLDETIEWEKPKTRAPRAATPYPRPFKRPFPIDLENKVIKI